MHHGVVTAGIPSNAGEERIRGVLRSLQALHTLAHQSQENLQPAQAVDALNDRVKHVGRLNLEIAEWLKVYYYA